VTRRVAVLTTGRQDWGLLRSTCVALRDVHGADVLVLAGGMHLSPRHGLPITEVRGDGFEPAAEMPWLGTEAGLLVGAGSTAAENATAAAGDPPAHRQAGAALVAVGDALARLAPDALVLAGDRLETAAAALAATVGRVPLVHLHGGEQTGGAFDDALRHAITKLAHLHLVSHPEHARRVVALGEDPATVHVIGSPGLDALARPDLPGRAELEADLGIVLEPPVILVTVHPATLDPDPAAVAGPVLAAMRAVPATYVVTLPNSDPGGDAIRAALRAHADQWTHPDLRPHPGAMVLVAALGERRYWGLLRIADAILGNSSSAIVEAPAVDLPAVDVGDRQEGRRREANVIHAPAEADAVEQALRRALDPAFRAAARAARPPLADGRAGERAARIISAWEPSRPPRKAPIAVTG
jgi:UDP-N-acetylglucosamine 2-epimerase (non-hydrolysing)